MHHQGIHTIVSSSADCIRPRCLVVCREIGPAKHLRGVPGHSSMFTNLMQVRRSAEPPVPANVSSEQLQLSFECSGSERVEPSWVGHLYRPDVTAVKDNRVR